MRKRDIRPGRLPKATIWQALDRREERTDGGVVRTRSRIQIVAGKIKAIGRGGDPVEMGNERGDRLVVEIESPDVRHLTGGRIVVGQIALIKAKGIQIAQPSGDRVGVAAVLPNTVGGDAFRAG